MAINPTPGMAAPRPPLEVPDSRPPEGTPNDPVNVPTPGDDIITPGGHEPLGIPAPPGSDLPAPPLVPEVI